MAKGKAKSSSKNKNKSRSSFIRTLQTHSKASSRSQVNYREGLALARKLTPSSLYPAIVDELFRSPAHKHLIAQLEFPKTYSEFIRIKTKVENLTEDQAFIWHASVLGKYIDQLISFPSLQIELEELLLQGFLSEAKEKLDTIESLYGVSMWLITKRLYLIQLMDGDSAQKTYVQQVIESPGFSILAALATYFISMASEEGQSLSQLEEEMSSFLTMDLMKEFAKSCILPYKLHEIDALGSLLSLMEHQPLIDRLQSFIAVAQVGTARNGISADSYIYTAAKILEPLPDPRIQKIIALVEKPKEVIDYDYTEGLANYTKGDYNLVRGESTDLIELIATSHAHLNEPPYDGTPKNLYQKIIFWMYEILRHPNDSGESFANLKKVSIFFTGISLPARITAFLQCKQDYIFDDELDIQSNLAAISGRTDNPKNWKIYQKLNRNFALPIDTNDLTSKLYKSLSLDYEHGVAALSSLGLPKYREEAYKGHLASNDRKLSIAADHYKNSINHGNDYVKNRGYKYLFKSLFDNSNFSDCAKLLVEIHLSGIDVLSTYPVAQLAEKLLEDYKLTSDVTTAIVLKLASLLDQDWEKPLSDIYENIMDSMDVDKPSSISTVVFPGSPNELVFFYRHICVTRILGDTTAFTSPEDIDQERISICQKLIELDPPNASAYSAEIRSITRDSKVSAAIKQIEASNIYVDEEGVKVATDNNIKERYIKYMELMSSPEKDAKTQELAKNIEKIIGDKIDVKNMEFPAVDRKGILSNMIHHFVQNFALHPAYGLDTHLSSGIRHGKFEGHLRNPLATHDLLCSRDKGRIIFPVGWDEKIPDMSPQERLFLFKALERFTVKIESLIDNFLLHLLHIRTETQPVGMFNMFASEDERSEIREKISICSDHKEFIEVLLEFSWELTTRSLSKIQTEIDVSLRKSVINAFDLLLNTISNNEIYTPVIKSIINSRIEADKVISEVKAWFKKPIKARHDPFDLDLALDVGSKQIENCYAKHKAYVTREINTSVKFQGKYIGGVVEVIFILFQNVLLHSGHGEGDYHIIFTTNKNGGDLTISVTSNVSTETDLAELSKMAACAVAKYNDKLLPMARKEGGSGLSKIWRIMNYYLKKTSNISLEVSDNGQFTTTLTILNVEDLLC
ncbi:hypothetical protein ACPZMI_19460 [Pseudomonas wayambapalatensis]|uniref:hypothetical protein n=1 Tax=Pseudomonas wayambapalatensis TaxID=485895 RepID=UPI003CF84452